MTQRDYKDVAVRLYYREPETYIELFNSTKNLCHLGLLPMKLFDFAWELDKKLFNREINDEN
jgi:hypothetical protein